MNRADSELLCSFSGPIDRATAPSTHCPLPRAPGVYAWFFENLLPSVPESNCLRDHGRLMLYVGIAPETRFIISLSIRFVSTPLAIPRRSGSSSCSSLELGKAYI
jgi:hypothetical protein